MTNMKRPSGPINFTAKHLFSIDLLTDDELLYLLTLADYYAARLAAKAPIDPCASGKTQINVFFENSTRTNASFELAGKKLGADVIVIPVAASSVHKGEALLDTSQTLAAMGADAMVVRSHVSGACSLIADALANTGSKDCAILNAGEATTDHPSQALLDALTIFQAVGRVPADGLDGVTIAICGDSRHSRVASSNCQLLPRLGAKLRFVGPKDLRPKTSFHPEIPRFEDMDEGLTGCDIVMALRIQLERLPPDITPDPALFFAQYGLTHERLAICPNALVMHPGPINRGIEISGDLADDPARSLILRQVQNGVPTRMALLDALLGARHKG